MFFGIPALKELFFRPNPVFWRALDQDVFGFSFYLAFLGFVLALAIKIFFPKVVAARERFFGK